MPDRIHSVDSLRAIAILFVVIAHVEPFLGYGEYGNYVLFLLDTLGQFDLPLFFITSGYFLAKKMNPQNVISYLKSAISKLGSLYLFGILLYFPLQMARDVAGAVLGGGDVTSVVLARIMETISPIHLLYYGDSVLDLLWFLTALIYAMCIVGLFVKFEKTRYLLPVAATLHIAGLVSTNYPMIFDMQFLVTDPLFFGLFYLVLGYTINSINWKPDKSQSSLYLALVVFFFVMQVVEQYVVSYILRDSAISQEVYLTGYTFTTVFLVTGILVWAISRPDWGKQTILPKLGEYTVGVYLLHMVAFYIIKGMNAGLEMAVGIDLTNTILWHISIVPIVYALSVALYIWAEKIGVIEIGGSHIPKPSRIRTQVRNMLLGKLSTSN